MRRDGRIELRLETTGRKELIRWVLSWMPDLKVLALKAFKTGSRRNYGMDSQCKIGNNTNSNKRLQRAMPLNRDVRV